MGREEAARGAAAEADPDQSGRARYLRPETLRGRVGRAGRPARGRSGTTRDRGRRVLSREQVSRSALRAPLP